MITAKLWTLAQCRNWRYVTAHDRHSYMCSCSRSCLFASKI